MHSRQRSRLFGAGLMLGVACTLALAACNSNSVSGNQPKALSSTNAEVKSSPSRANGSRPQGLVGAAILQIR
jgi:hypothetical protein